MPAPTNTSFATATDFVSLPQTITQRVDDAGTTYTVYFRVPASFITANVTELSIFGFGDLSTYTPTTRVYVGPAGSATQIVRPASDDPAGLNLTIQVPVDAGNDYFVEVTTNAGNPSPANLTLLVQAAANDAIQNGDIVIPDDTAFYPAVVLDPRQDYAIRRFVHPFSASEQGDTLHTSGHSLMLRRPTDVAIDHLGLFDETYAFTLGIGFDPAIGNTPPAIRANQTTQRFWVAYFNDPTLYAFAIAADGTTSTVENLGDTYLGINAVATSPDESILYFVETNDSLIRAWDLVNHVALPDFVAQTASYVTVDLLVLSDGTVLAGLYKPSATLDFKVNHYSASGTLLASKSFGSDIRNVTPRLASSIDNLTTYWAYLPRPSSGANRGKSNVQQVQVSDGSILVNRTYAQYEVGKDSAAATATPLAAFGASNSCPFWIAASGFGAPVSSGRRGIYVPTRGDAGSEGGGAQARFQDLNGLVGSTTAGRIVAVLAGAEGNRNGAQGGMSGGRRAIYVPTIGVAGAEGDPRWSETFANLAIRRIVVYDGEGYTHR